MDTVTVSYNPIVNWENALRCHRCQGTGTERFTPEQCPRCKGSGQHPKGWAYRRNGLDVAVGDVVEVPPTPRTVGDYQTAVVVALYSDHDNPRSSLIRVVDSSSSSC